MPAAKTAAYGVVTWFDWRKGFGFIRPEVPEDAAGVKTGAKPDGNTDAKADPKADDGEIFVSYEDIERDGFKTLETGERVSYQLKPGEGGRKAAKVSPA